jgi:hypothetical protein
VISDPVNPETDQDPTCYLFIHRLYKGLTSFTEEEASKDNIQHFSLEHEIS